MTIKYEELVQHPKEVTHRICNFLIFPGIPDMLQPEKQDHAGEKAITNNIWYTREEYKRSPTDNEIEKWKRQLNFNQKAALFYLFRIIRTLKELGHPLPKTNSPIVDLDFMNMADLPIGFSSFPKNSGPL